MDDLTTVKISNVTVDELANYLRETELSDTDRKEIAELKVIATAFMKEYTGRTVEELDGYPECVIALKVLVQDMWDNRTLYVDKNSRNVNRVVETILGLHCVNLL